MSTLVVIDGPAQGRVFPLVASALVSVGRDDQCEVQILDDQISRKHLQLRFDDVSRTFVAADCRSANGVFVNGSRLMRDTPLRDGDRIKIGCSTIVFAERDFPDAASAMRDLGRKKDEWQRSTIVRPE